MKVYNGKTQKDLWRKKLSKHNALLKNVNAEYSTVEKTRLEKSWKLNMYCRFSTLFSTYYNLGVLLFCFL